MIGLDSNILIRYLTQDDKKQAAKANALIDEKLTLQEPGYITLINLVEVIWVLETCYKQSKDDLVEILHGLLTTRQLLIESADIAYLALKRFTAGKVDFSDALIKVISERNGCSCFFTFDKKATSIGMTLL